MACLLGEALGNVVAVATYEIASSTTIASELRWGIAIGVAVGSMQWVLLRRRIDYSQWWIVLTTIGWVIAFITPRFIRLPELLAEAVYQGVPVGTMQWLLLRRSVSRAAWWILIVSMAALITIGAEFDALGRPHWKIWDSAPWGPMAGALKGVITGFGLGILLQRSGRGLRA